MANLVGSLRAFIAGPGKFSPNSFADEFSGLRAFLEIGDETRAAARVRVILDQMPGLISTMREGAHFYAAIGFRLKDAISLYGKAAAAKTALEALLGAKTPLDLTNRSAISKTGFTG